MSAALFAYKEITQEATSFAPFKLTYGRIPKGPSQMYRVWTGVVLNSELADTSEYVHDLSLICCEVMYSTLVLLLDL